MPPVLVKRKAPPPSGNKKPPPSPKKKSFVILKPAGDRNAVTVRTEALVNPELFPLVAFWFEKGDGNEAYTYHMKQVVKGDVVCEYLPNVVAYNERRIEHGLNLPRLSGGYPKTIFTAYHASGENTPEIRMELLETMKRFIMDSRFSKYPERKVNLEDLTNDNNYGSLDKYFLDDRIEEICRLHLEAGDELNTTLLLICLSSVL